MVSSGSSMTRSGRAVSSYIAEEAMKAHQKGYRKKEGAEGAQMEARERGGKGRENQSRSSVANTGTGTLHTLSQLFQ